MANLILLKFPTYKEYNFPYENTNFSEYNKNFKLNENKPNGISLEFIKDLIYDLEYLTKLTLIQQKIKLDLLKKEYQKSEMK